MGRSESRDAGEPRNWGNDYLEVSLSRGEVYQSRKRGELSKGDMQVAGFGELAGWSSLGLWGVRGRLTAASTAAGEK